MVEAAYKLFSERGWNVPLTAIAEEAGVAVQTLYFTFHTKVALLNEALALAVLGDDQPIPPHERPWFHAMAGEPDVRMAIAMVVDNTMPIFARVAPLARALRSGDPEIVAMWQRSEQLRHDGYRKLVQTIAKKAELAVGLDEAVDIAFMLLSPDLYWMAVSERGWSPERWSSWLKRALADALLGR
jgi:AcrR family transcriptional regulator